MSAQGTDRSFEELVHEAASAPIDGWDFTWLEGRATEERPSWGYSDLVAARAARAAAVLDLQCGGAELLSELPPLGGLLVATEGWPPNLALASRRLRQRDQSDSFIVSASGDRPALPFRQASFDLVTSRHPITTRWDEVARVLKSGGIFLSQQVGPRSVGELTEFLMGPQPETSRRDPEVARSDAEAAGLGVTQLLHERLRVVFYDVGAVVYFLRLVVWIVPGFTVEAYQGRLLDLHCDIRRHGPFVAHSSRFLIEACANR